MAGFSVEFGMRDGTFYVHSDEGFSYHQNRVMRGGRLSLRCIHYAKRRCRGRASVDPEGRDFHPGVHRHNHDRDWNIKHVRRFRSFVLQECRKRENGNESLREIYHRVRRDLRCPRQSIISLHFTKLRPSMDRARSTLLPNIPHTLSELADILEQDQYEFLTKTLDEEDNIYLGKFGQSSTRTRVLIFASHRAIQYLNSGQVHTAFSDGTFSTVPAALKGQCAQIWSIIAIRRHHVLPLVRVLMQSKTQPCYEAALRALKDVAPNFRPQKVMADFEMAQANAWEAVFPNVDLDGCLFHSSKDIAGKAKEMGLTVLIRDNEDVDSLVRRLCALALLPYGHAGEPIFEGLASVAASAVDLGFWPDLENLFTYVSSTWLIPSRLRMFSVYRCPHRTNNGCESSNAALRREFKTDHPVTWVFLYALNNLEDITAFDIEVLDGGFDASSARRTSALANDAALRGHYADLDEGNIDVNTFLIRASRRLQNVYDMILHL
ncbi:uncharacterized protein LOC117649475 isoform X2 [Thrips palmi]|nr:uncharacterized protein LOC117649475 isoform X2 [Thrips palmi]